MISTYVFSKILEMFVNLGGKRKKGPKIIKAPLIGIQIFLLFHELKPLIIVNYKNSIDCSNIISHSEKQSIKKIRDGSFSVSV